jgi:hypothetical protein
MKKSDLFIGVFIGFATTFVGVYLFFILYANCGLIEGIKMMQEQGYLGKIITLGAILNLIAFFILLKLNKELMARGVVLSLIILALITIFI